MAWLDDAGCVSMGRNEGQTLEARPQETEKMFSVNKDRLTSLSKILTAIIVLAGGIRSELGRRSEVRDRIEMQRALVAEADTVVSLRDVQEDERAFRIFPWGILIPYCEGCWQRGEQYGMTTADCLRQCDRDGDDVIGAADLAELRETGRASW